MLRKMMASLGLATIAVAAIAVPAGAAGTGSVAPNPVQIAAGSTTGTATVSWSGMQTGPPVYLSICRRAQTDPLFVDYGTSCSNLSEVIVSAAFQSGGAGSKALNTFFRAENPDGDSGWGCFAPGDTAPAGVEKLTTCYVRVASAAESDTTYAFTMPFTLTDASGPTTTVPATTTTTVTPVVPEASNVVLLPVVAGGIALLAFAVQRRRKSAEV